MSDVRFLSSARRTGVQLGRDAADGRSQRHAQGWRDNLDDDDALGAFRGLINGLAIMAAVWGVIGVLVMVAVHLVP